LFELDVHDSVRGIRASPSSAIGSTIVVSSSEDSTASAPSTSEQVRQVDGPTPMHSIRKSVVSGETPHVPSKKLKLFDFMSRHMPSTAAQQSHEKPDFSRDFQRFLDSNVVGLQTFDDPLLASSLRPVAMQLFSAPCSSAASERVFSQSGLIMRPTRSRLSPSRLAKLSFLKCNKHLR